MSNMHDRFGWWALIRALWMLFFWGVLIWLASRLFTEGDGRDSVEIARHRYARGEITREEFLQLVDELTRAGRSSPGERHPPAAAA